MDAHGGGGGANARGKIKVHLILVLLQERIKEVRRQVRLLESPSTGLDLSDTARGGLEAVAVAEPLKICEGERPFHFFKDPLTF